MRYFTSVTHFFDGLPKCYQHVFGGVIPIRYKIIRTRIIQLRIIRGQNYSNYSNSFQKYRQNYSNYSNSFQKNRQNYSNYSNSFQKYRQIQQQLQSNVIVAANV